MRTASEHVLLPELFLFIWVDGDAADIACRPLTRRLLLLLTHRGRHPLILTRRISSSINKTASGDPGGTGREVGGIQVAMVGDTGGDGEIRDAGATALC